MTMTRTASIRYLKMAAGVAVIAVVVGYAIWRSYSYAKGPEIELQEPSNGSTIASSTAVIIGHARRISSLNLNGHPLSVDENDRFSDAVVIFPGLNVISLSAADQFGRSTELEIRVWGEAPSI